MGRSEEIAELKTVFTLDGKSFSKQMSSINKEIKNAEKEFKSAKKGVEGFEDSFSGLNAKMTKTSKQLDLYNLKLDKQKEAYAKLQSTLEKQKDKLKDIENTLGKGSDEWEKQAQLVAKNSDKLSNLSSDIKITETNISKLTSEFNQTKSAMEQLGNKTKTLDENLEDINREADLTKSEFEKLGSELENSGNYFQKLGNEMNKLAAEIDAGVQRINAYENEISKLSSELESNMQDHQRLSSEINKTETELKQAESAYGQNSNEANQLRTKLYQLKDEYINLEDKIEKNNSTLDKYQTELNQTQTEVNKLSNELKSLPLDTIGNDLVNAGEKVKGVGQSLTMGVTTPLVAVGAAATKVGIEFSSAMSTLKATLGPTKATKEAMNSLEDAALKAGSTTSKSSSEAAQALNYMALAGWSVEECMAGLMPILRLSEAGNVDLANASDLVTDSMGGLGLQVNELNGYLDKVAKTSQTTNTNIDVMLEAFNATSGPAKTLGIDISELSSSIGVLANSSYKGSEGGRALSTVLTRLAKPPAEAEKSLKSLGVSVFDSSGKFRGLETVLGDLNNAFSSLTEEEAMYHAKNIAGQNYLSQFITLVDGAGGAMQGFTTQIRDSNGSMEEMALTMQDNLGGEISSMSSALEGALRDAFLALEPAISTVVNWIKDAANWFNELDSGTQKNIVGMAAFAAALGPILMGIGQLIIIGGNATLLFNNLSGIMTGAGAATGTLTSAIGLLTGPVGLGALAIALAGLIAKVGDSANAIDWLQTKFGSLGAVIGAVCELISGVWDATMGQLSNVAGFALDSVAALIDGPGGATISDAWNKFTGNLESTHSSAWDKVTLKTSRELSQQKNNVDSKGKEIASSLDKSTKEAANKVDKNTKDMSIKVDTNTKDASKKAKANMDQGATDIGNATSKMASEASKGTAKVAQTTDTDFKKANKSIQQSSTDMYNGAKNSFTKLTDVANQEGTRMHSGVKTSAEKMASSAKASATDMYRGVTNSTTKMANQAIADWNRVRNAYSKPINAKITTTKTTITKTQAARSIDHSPVPLAANVRSGFNILDLNSIVTRGSYFSLSTENSKITSSSGSIESFNKKLEIAMDYMIRKVTPITININDANINSGKITDSWELREFARDIAEYVEEEIAHRLARRPGFR